MNDKDLQHLAAIVRDSDDAILGKTLDGIITSWNGGAERMYGYTAAEAIGRTVAMLVPSDREDELPEILQKLTDGKRINNYSTLRVTKDGSVLNVSLTISPIRDVAGTIIGASSIARDVTKEKEAEAALRESARAYKLLMDQASDAILVSYPDQPLIEVNQRASDMLGYTKEELLQLHEESSLPKSLSALPILPDELPERDIVYSERAVRRKDGTIIVTELSARRLDDGRIVTIARDITDRKRAEEALSVSEARLRIALDLAQLSRYEWDPQTDELNWDMALREIWGLSADTAVNNDIFLMSIHPDDRDAVQAEIAKSRDPAGDGMYVAEFRVIGQHGKQERWVSSRGKTFFAGNIAVHHIGVAQEITERRQAEITLQESEERYRLVTDTATDVIIAIDDESKILFANRAVEGIFGYPVAQVIGQPLTMLMPESMRQHHLAGINRYIETGRKQVDWGAIELQGLHKSGKEIPLEISFAESSENGKRIFTGTMRDVTERSRAVEARTARDAAERANQAKSEFLSRMSHELRTPLNAILGFSQILQMDSSTPEQEESVSYILKAGRHLLSLINEVLDIARIEEGKLTISMEPVFLRDVLQESLDLVQPLAARRSIEVKMDLAWMDSCHVMADRQRLQQVLWNLLANAIKYNRVGGTVNVSCDELNYEAAEAQLQQVQGKVRISVSDTGLGLSPDKVARLFTPFERLGAEQGDVEGTGLGLALSKHLVGAMGGVIGVESEQDVGSTFWVELSLADEQMPPIDFLVTGPLFNINIGPPAQTILYIEDNLSNLRLIERIVRKRPGIKLVTAMQGQKGLDMAYEYQPDKILLDLHLPDMPGQEVMRQLREDPRTASIPVIILSADANPRQVAKLLAAGAQDYLTKPLDVEHLLRVLGETPARVAG
jgi:PAS domain S-box-containing protein